MSANMIPRPEPQVLSVISGCFDVGCDARSHVELEVLKEGRTTIEKISFDFDDLRDDLKKRIIDLIKEIHAHLD